MADLSRFHTAQQYDYETALAEIKRGRKTSHWIWYVFPQITGLGRSSMAEYYAIKDLNEAIEYYDDPVLRERLVEISSALLEISCNDPTAVMGCPDDLKLRSSMTLFSVAAPECSVFQAVLDKFFAGTPDKKTLQILGLAAEE